MDNAKAKLKEFFLENLIYFSCGLITCLFVFLFVGYFVFNIRKIQQFSHVASVSCCVFVQYSKEGLLPYVAISSIARDPVHKRKGWAFQGTNSSSYTRLLSSVAAKYETNNHLETCCIMKPPLSG